MYVPCRFIGTKTGLRKLFSCFLKVLLRGGRNRGVNLPSPYFLSQFLPPPYFFEPISPSSQLCLGHFTLLPILFLPPLLINSLDEVNLPRHQASFLSLSAVSINRRGLVMRQWDCLGCDTYFCIFIICFVVCGCKSLPYFLVVRVLHGIKQCIRVIPLHFMNCLRASQVHSYILFPVVIFIFFRIWTPRFLGRWRDAHSAHETHVRRFDGVIVKGTGAETFFR